MNALRLALLTVWGFLAPALAAQATLSVAPLVDALRNPDLLSAAGDPKLEAARKSVRDLLLNQPSESELEGFNTRLKLLCEHRETRLGRLFFAALDATPGVEKLPEAATDAGVAAYFPLELGSGIQTRVGWRRAGEAMKISQFSVSITGNAGALLAMTGPYFGSGTPDRAKLNQPELDYLLGRDPADLMKLEADRGAFDFDAAIKRRFELKAGDAVTLLQSLREGLADGKDAKDKAALLAKHLDDKERAMLASPRDAKFWARIKAQVEALSAMAGPVAVPAREGASVTVSQTAPEGASEWGLRRTAAGTLALSGSGIGLADEKSE